MRPLFDNTDQTLVDRVAVETPTKTWRPIRDILLMDPNDDQIKKLQTKVTPAAPAGSTPIVAGAPGNLSAIFAVQSPAKTQGRTVSEVSVTFNVNPSAAYSNTRIWITGYKGNPNPVLQTAGASGPVNFLLETTGETITITGQPVAQDGSVIALSSCLSTTVVLNGVISAPPSPTISQTLVSIPLGYQFSYTQLNLGATQDVVDSYRIYRNNSNVFAGSSLIRVNRHDPTNANAVVVQDVTGGGQTFYYFVTAINTIGLESPATSAQSGAIVSGTASLDADVADGNVFLRTPQFLNDMLLENGNFEASATACSISNPPPGWSIYGGAGNLSSVSYDTSAPFSGNQSIKIVVGGAAAAGLITFRKFAVRAGDKLFASAQVKATAGTAHLAVDFRNGSGSSIGGFDITTTNAAYTLLSSSAVAPAGTVYCTIEIYGAINSTVFFDEVYLRAVRSLDNEVQDGTTYARVTTTPATGLNTGNAVAASGNLLLKNVGAAVGSTVSPTSNSATFAVIPEMTKTITTKGNKVLVLFTGNFVPPGTTAVTVVIAVFVDGVQATVNAAFTTAGSDEHPMTITYLDSPSAASHTYDVRWSVSTSGASVSTPGTARSLQVVELG